MTTINQQAVVDVLRSHQRNRGVRDLHVHCLCRWVSAQTGPSGTGEHLEHQADKLLGLLRGEQRRAKRQPRNQEE